MKYYHQNMKNQKNWRWNPIEQCVDDKVKSITDQKSMQKSFLTSILYFACLHTKVWWLTFGPTLVSKWGLLTLEKGPTFAPTFDEQVGG